MTSSVSEQSDMVLSGGGPQAGARLWSLDTQVLRRRIRRDDVDTIADILQRPKDGIASTDERAERAEASLRTISRTHSVVVSSSAGFTSRL